MGGPTSWSSIIKRGFVYRQKRQVSEEVERKEEKGKVWLNKVQGKLLVRNAGRLECQTEWQYWEEAAATHAGEGGRE